MHETDQELLAQIAGIRGFQPGTAFNLRQNGEGVERHSTPNIQITPKSDQPGLNIHISAQTSEEEVHIPVILTKSGITDVVANDFYIEAGAKVKIIAGCGIHNDGCDTSEHNGIHTFHIGKNAKVTYIEKHYGEGNGDGKRILNPSTVVYMDEGAYMEMDSAQIKGVDSTKRNMQCHLKADAKLMISERLMTHGKQNAVSDVSVFLDGENSSVRIVSRSVGKDESVQVFHPIAVGNARCKAHIQCDSILMDQAKISSIPEITANHVDAQIVHEAAIGKINSEQLIKLETFGLAEEEAEAVIVEGFLK